MKNIIWAGAGGNHKPGDQHPSSEYEGILWHAKRSNNTLYNYISHNNGIILKAGASSVIKGGKLFVDGVDVTSLVLDSSCLLLTWNYNSASKDDVTKLKLLEDNIVLINPRIRVINSTKSIQILNNKSGFFNKMADNGLSSIIPKFYTINSLNDLVTANLRYPFIIRADNLSGGAFTYLARNYREARKIFFFLKGMKSISGLAARIISNVYIKSIIAVEYYNTYDANLNAHMTFRVFIWGNKLYYAYPHISPKTWCAHTNMHDKIGLNKYEKACEKVIEYVNQFKRELTRMTELTGISTLALDCLVNNNGELRILEPELKYGPDINYINGHEAFYNLDHRFYRFIMNGIGCDTITISDLFSYKTE